MAGSSAPLNPPLESSQTTCVQDELEIQSKSAKCPSPALERSQTINVKDIVRCEKIEWEDVQSPDVIFVSSSASVKFYSLG